MSKIENPLPALHGVVHGTPRLSFKGRPRPFWDVHAHEGHCHPLSARGRREPDRHVHDRGRAESPRLLDNVTEPKREGCPGRGASDLHSPHTPTWGGFLSALQGRLLRPGHPPCTPPQVPFPLPRGARHPGPDTLTSSKPPKDTRRRPSGPPAGFQCARIANHPQQRHGSELAGLWWWPLGLLILSNQHVRGDRPCPPTPELWGCSSG